MMAERFRFAWDDLAHAYQIQERVGRQWEIIGFELTMLEARWRLWRIKRARRRCQCRCRGMCRG